MTYSPQWSPPPPPKQSGIAWLWVVIAVLVVVAAVRMNTSPRPSPARPNVPSVPVQSASNTSVSPDMTTASGAFCTTYYVFSINVSASWASFADAVTQGDASGALALAAQFQGQASAMQQSDPPPALGAALDTVVHDLQETQAVLASGTVSGLPDVNATRTDITDLQAASDSACG